MVCNGSARTRLLQISKDEMISDHILARYYCDFGVEHRPGIDKGVKLPIFTAGVNTIRQPGQEAFIEMATGKRSIQLVGIDAGQYCFDARPDHLARESVSRYFPYGE